MTMQHQTAVLLLSTNPKEDLRALFHITGKNSNDLDFAIESYETEYFDNETGARIDPSEFDYFNVKHSVSQAYKLKIFKRIQEPNINVKLTTKNIECFSVDATYSAAGYKFDARTIVSDLLSALHKKKLQHGLLIGLFEEEALDAIQSLAQQIIDNNYALANNIQIPALRAYEPVYYTSGSVDLLTPIGETNKDKVILQALSNKPLIIARHGQKGRNGRNGFGRAIYVDDSINTVAPQIDAFGDISVSSDENGIVYTALSDGHAEYDGKTIVLGAEIHRKKIDFKSGDMELPRSSVKVSPEDSLTDALNGAKLHGKNIVIDGAVGSEGILKGSSIELNGQSNKHSQIYAQNAKLKHHKGYIEAEKITIENLETGGRVVGTDIEIELAVGGMIRGENVYIKKLLGNNTIIATKKIVIDEVAGVNNRLTIEYGVSQKKLNEVESKNAELSRIQNKAHIAIRKLTEANNYLKRHADVIKTKRNDLNSCKSRGMEPGVHITKVLKMEEDKRELIKQLSAEIQTLNSKEGDLKRELSSMREAIYGTHISIKNGIDTKTNSISFITAFPIKKIDYKAEHSHIKSFNLDGNNKIVVSN